MKNNQYRIPNTFSPEEVRRFLQKIDTTLTSSLIAISSLATTDGNIIVGNGTTWIAESGNTARTSLGLGATDSPQFTNELLTGYIDLYSITEPSSPNSGYSRIYSYEDNGFTEIEIKNNTGIKKRLIQDSYRIFRNDSGGTISKAKVVYYSGVSGGRANFKLAKSDSLLTMPCVGVTSASVENGDFAEVIVTGRLSNIKTNYATWSVGDKLYVDSSSAGELTNIKPSAENYCQCIGFIESIDSTNGSIFIDILNYVSYLFDITYSDISNWNDSYSKRLIYDNDLNCLTSGV